MPDNYSLLSEFKEFSQEGMFTFQTSSPLYPKGNDLTDMYTDSKVFVKKYKLLMLSEMHC